MGKTHNLKTHPGPFQKVWDDQKVAEVRFDDRGFEVGDHLILSEFLPDENRFTGRGVTKRVSDITKLADWIPNVGPEWVVLHMKECGLKEAIKF